MAEFCLTDQPTVAAFDFDGTITTRDTFVPFLFLAFGKLATYRAFARLFWEALLVLTRCSSRDRFKEKIVRELFTGESVERLTEVGCVHATRIRQLVRPLALERIMWHKSQGHRLILVSASLDLYLRPIYQELGFDDLLCTNLSKVDGIFDGYLVGMNCRGQEKVERLKILIGDLSTVKLHAYGDSVGDKEMLEIASIHHWRPFELGKKFSINTFLV